MAFLCALAACAPTSCSGAFETPLNANQNDNRAVNRRCVGNNTEIKDDVNIKNQLELDALEGCERIEGILVIQGATDIVNLDKLEALREIDQGYFLALNNVGLLSVDLPNLERVDYGVGVIENPDVTAVTMTALGTQDAEGATFGDITLRTNANLANVQFPAVQEIRTDLRNSPGNLILGNNPKLSNLSGFIALEKVEGALFIFGDDALTNFTGLEQLNEITNTGNVKQALAIGIDFNEDDEVIAAGNAALNNLAGLNNLEIVNGDVFIGFNPQLQDLDGLDDLAVLQNNLFIVGNGNLENLSGLEGDNNGDGNDDGLSTVAGSIFLGLFFDRFGQPIAAGNDSLNDLAGLNSLVTLGGGAAQNGFAAGSLVVAFNQQFATFDGLDLLTTVGGDLVIVGSRQLDNFTGAQLLTTITGSLVMGQLSSNTDRIIQPGNDDEAVQPEFDEMADQNGVQVTDTGTAIDFELDFSKSFPLLTTIGKDLVVAFSDLDNLSFSQQLTSIGGRMVLHGSAQPANLTGLDTVSSYGGLAVGLAVDKRGNLQPSPNGAFDAFTGFNVNVLGAGGLAIGFNNNLNTLASLPTLNTVAGSVTIVNTDVNNLADLNVQNIGGNLSIGAIVNGDDAPINAQNQNLDALNFNALQNVGGDVLLAFNAQQSDTTMNGLQNVAGAFEITALNNLEVITGLGALNTVGDMLVHDLTALTTLDLSGLNSAGRDLQIVDNPQLETLSLNSLADVGGTLELRNLPLNDLGSLAQLQNVGDLATATGDLALIDLADLDTLNGFGNLNTVGGSLFLVRADTLEDLNLPQLTSVGGSLELGDLERPVDLEGLETLSTVGDAVRIHDCTSLTTLKGLEGLVTVGRVFSIVNNPELDIVVRDEDVQNQIDVVAGVVDQGLVFLAQVGDPNFDGVGGVRGVIEAKNNPRVREEDLVNIVQDFADQYEGFFVLCGNEDSGQNDTVPSLETCPDLAP